MLKKFAALDVKQKHVGCRYYCMRTEINEKLSAKWNGRTKRTPK